MKAIPARLRQLNQTDLLQTLRRCGRASRAELALRTGISAPTVGKIVDDLLRAEVLEETETETGERRAVGRPGRKVGLEATIPRFLLVQLGVRHTRVTVSTVFEPATKTLAVFRTPRRADTWARKLAEVMLPDTGAAWWGVLLSVPGVVDEAAGTILLSPNLPWAGGLDLRRLFPSTWPRTVCVVHEVHASALGHRDQTGEDSLLLVNVDDGLGAAAMVHGELRRGTLPLSGELGHTPVIGNRRRCGCGALGCLETLGSKSGILATYAESFRVVDPSWEQVLARIEAHGVEPWLTATLEAVAAGIAGALNVTGLDRAVLTGMFTELPESATSWLCDAIVRGSMWARFGRVTASVVPDRRVVGLLSAGFERLVIPTSDWSRPCARDALVQESLARDEGLPREGMWRGGVASDEVVVAPGGGPSRKRSLDTYMSELAAVPPPTAS